MEDKNGYSANTNTNVHLPKEKKIKFKGIHERSQVIYVKAFFK